MPRALPIIAALSFVAPGVVHAQTINGESNYEDGISHIPPKSDEPSKAEPSGSAAGQRVKPPTKDAAGSK